MASKAWLLVKSEIDNGNIREWVRTMTEEQIALSCGISYSSFQKFKKQYKELEKELIEGKKLLCSDLKSSLIKKALGYDIEETTTLIKEDGNGKKTKEIKKVVKHYPPDTGAIHLLLKNNDDDWHNDDVTTIKLKQKELEIKQGIDETSEESENTYLKGIFEQISMNGGEGNE